MIRTAVFVIALVVFAIVFASGAAAAPIFPPLVSGEYVFAVATAEVAYDPDGVPLEPPTRSIGIRRMDLADTPLILCLPAGPGERIEVLVRVAASGDRGELRGVAFNAPGCTSYESEPSANGAFVFFVPPAAPRLELAAPGL